MASCNACESVSAASTLHPGLHGSSEVAHCGHLQLLVGVEDSLGDAKPHATRGKSRYSENLWEDSYMTGLPTVSFVNRGLLQNQNLNDKMFADCAVMGCDQFGYENLQMSLDHPPYGPTTANYGDMKMATVFH